MKHTNYKSVIQIIVICCLLVGMVCLNGCKKTPPQPTVTTPTTTAPTETTSPVEDTEPVSTTPVQPTTPPPTNPSNDTTAPNDCEHILDNWVVDIASTCTNEGIRYRDCLTCRYRIETEVIPVSGHSVSEWIVDEEATCTSLGKQHQECTQCTEKLVYITVGMKDHRVTTIEGYAATSTTPGRTDRLICKTCDATVQESYVIPIVGSVLYTYQVNSDGSTCTITGVINFSDQQLMIPDTLYGYTVTAIGDNAFANRYTITTAYIPASVTQIGAKAFNGCPKLTTIVYQNTTEQWTLMPKGADWNANTGKYVVFCTNTNIAK